MSVDLADVLVLPETVPCSVCKKPIKLSYNQQHRALRPDAKFSCPGDCRQQAQKVQTAAQKVQKEKRLGPSLVVCVMCNGEFYPSWDVWRKHQSGEMQRYYCPDCVRQASGNRNTPNQRFGLPEVAEDAKRAAFLKLYFLLEAKGQLPILNIWRRAW